MAINYKVLGQLHPGTTAEANVYTVPAATQAIISTMSITNLSGATASARVWVRIGGAATAAVNSILYDVPLAANSVAAFTLGLTLGATDIVTVRTSVGSVLTFQLFGSEIS
jgi:hypothetical protein